MRKTVSSIVFLLILLFGFIFIPSLLPAQKIKIKTENGVTVVYNPKNPAPPPGTPTKLILKEDLTIGEKEESEEYMFSRMESLDVDDEGNIYVLDSKESHVKVFDKDGKYVRTFCRKGQGPGEMQRALNVVVTLQREIMVNDWRSRRLLYFTLDGKFLREVSGAKMFNFNNPRVDSKGNVVANFTVMGAKTMSELKKFTSDLEPIFTIASIEVMRLPVLNPFFPVFFWEVIKEDNIIWGISTKYELRVLNTDGKLIKRIIKDYDPVKITEEDKEERLKAFGRLPPEVKIEFPKYHWAFENLSIDEEGRMFLRIHEKAENGEGSYYDVFDSEGRYIAKIPLKATPRVWKKNKLYTVEEDEEGYRFVKRYSLEWK